MRLNSTDTRRLVRHAGAGIALLALAACGAEEAPAADAGANVPDRPMAVARDTMLPAGIEAVGAAEPVQRSTLATKLMATVTEVLVREGDRVRRGQVLVRLDARDVDAKRGQVAASIADADAMLADAERQVKRLRALYADSAAPRAQLDAAEAGLARATAGAAAARAAAAEVGAIRDYADVRAPFDGVVAQRFVDPGAFAAPGSPLVTVQDESMLRVRATVAPSLAPRLARGARIVARIEGRDVPARIEGMVSAPGNLVGVNALVENRDGALVAGAAAALVLGADSARAVIIPVRAIVREGDLVGVDVEREGGFERRWIRIGRTLGDQVEVLAGLRAGDRVALAATGQED